MYSQGRAKFGNPVAAVGLCLVILWCLAANAQNASKAVLADDGLHRVEAQGRELVLLPSHEHLLNGTGPQSPIDGLSVRTFPTASQQTIVVTFEGETFRATIPFDGGHTWLAFDPARRTFAELSASLRIELNESLDLEAVTDAVDATGVAVFESLGFAIVSLPRDLQPAEAAARVRNLPGQPDAALRLRAPRMRWR